MTTSATSRSAWTTLGQLLIVVGVAMAAVVVIAWFVGVRLELDGSGLRPMLSRFDRDTHDATLETDRATQPELPVTVSPSASDRRPEALWPAFRGAARDGRYRHPIRTDWPADGLPRLWQQPVGGGYASFAAADGRLFTIEQRRDREVVAAYDAETGHELWTPRVGGVLQGDHGG